MKTLTLALSVLIGSAALNGCSVEPTISTSSNWTTRSTTGYTPRSGDVKAVVNGKIYCIGGEVGNSVLANKNEVYDPVTDKWTSKSTAGFTPRAYAACAVVNGIIYVMGGSTGPQNTPSLNTVEAYDPGTDTWTTKSSIGFTRSGLFAAAAVNGKIYAIGGRTDMNPALNRVEEYDPAMDTWKSKSSAGFVARAYIDCTVVNGKIYVPYGHIISAFVNTNQVYDPSTDSWSTLAPGITNKYGVGVTAMNGRIYAIAGYNDGSFFNTVDQYDPVSNSWTSLPSTGLTARAIFEPCVVGSSIYVIGGNNSQIIGENTSYIP